MRGLEQNLLSLWSFWSQGRGFPYACEPGNGGGCLEGKWPSQKNQVVSDQPFGEWIRGQLRRRQETQVGRRRIVRP